jgi:hypothetical protein
MKGNKTASERLNAKTLDQMFVNMVEQGYECPPFVSNALLETAQSVFVQDPSNPNVMNVGQLMVLGIAVSEPAGKPLTECEIKTAVVTLDAGKEDEEIRSKYGLATLCQARLARVTHEV